MSVLRTQRINLGKIRSRTSRDLVFNQPSLCVSHTSDFFLPPVECILHMFTQGLNVVRYHFSVEGWSGLMDEMEMEVKRISKRNLGRDDR